MNPRRIVCVGAGPVMHNTSHIQIDPKWDFIIALDGGLDWLLLKEIVPHVFIGDCDSLTKINFQWLENSSVQKQYYPKEKDESDFELASNFIVSQFPTTAPVLLLNMMGGRTDHFLSNLAISKQLSLHGFYVEFLGDVEDIIISNGAKPIELADSHYTNISLYPLTEVVSGITTKNLKYPLHGESLFQNASRGLSNVPIGEKCTILHLQGILAILLVHGGKNENICRHCEH
ncbi:MAG: thiamine diphosphokinase [Caldisericia bacterium]|nr:thiamine diphosphokinase [Caldisericia bacterium]MDD4613870.1 thiamine diphosphokinase [Caldisericia bacterium]